MLSVEVVCAGARCGCAIRFRLDAARMHSGEKRMRGVTQIDLDMSVDDIMCARPETITVFLRNKMLCIGCILAPFHNVSDAALAHDLDEAEIMSQLTEMCTRVV